METKDEELDFTSQAIEMILGHPDVNKRLWKPLKAHLTLYLTSTAIIHLLTLSILLVILWKVMRTSN